MPPSVCITVNIEWRKHKRPDVSRCIEMQLKLLIEILFITMTRVLLPSVTCKGILHLYWNFQYLGVSLGNFELHDLVKASLL